MYASWKLNKEKYDYLMKEREGLSMIFSLQIFQHYLLVTKFNFFTNHQDLKYLVKKTMHQGKIINGYFSFNNLSLISQSNQEIILLS